ncbi:HK97 gp10 family phage protein [Lachnospiraceae bacterium 54-53]
MSNRRATVDQMAEVIMESMAEYADLSNEVMKECVMEVSKSVKKDIQGNAPVKSGRYKKSWAAKKVKENANSLTIVVHSRNRYQIAHLLEKGHAKRGGGRVAAIPHIATAEQRGAEELVSRIRRGLL